MFPAMTMLGVGGFSLLPTAVRLLGLHDDQEGNVQLGGGGHPEYSDSVISCCVL